MNRSVEGIVYVLINKAMPGLVKIGKTTREKVELRMNELYSTGVPLPFQCVFAGKVEDVTKVEKAFHTAFGPYRINKNREFFQIEPEQAIALVELMSQEDMTPQITEELDKVDQDSKAAVHNYKPSKRPNYDFHEMGIPVDSVLQSVDGEFYCEVISNRRVLFKDEEMSLTKATRQMKNLPYSVQPGLHWTFEGRRLSDIYDETYPLEEE